MLSTSEVILTETVVLGLDTTTVKMKLPPGAERLIGLADLLTAITGKAGATAVELVVVVAGGVNDTVALAVAVTMLPLVSTPVTVTVSVWLAPELPRKVPGKVHGADVAPGARVTPISVPQVEPVIAVRSP